MYARSNVYLSKVYFCKMYPTCVSFKLSNTLTFCHKFVSFETQNFPISHIFEIFGQNQREFVMLFEIKLASTYFQENLCTQKN